MTAHAAARPSTIVPPFMSEQRYASSPGKQRGPPPQSPLNRARRESSPRKAATPRFGTPTSQHAHEAAELRQTRPMSARAPEGARQDRLRGLMGSPVEAPWRAMHQFGSIDYSSFLNPPSAAKRERDKQEDAKRIAAMQRKDREEDDMIKREKARFAAKLKRDKQMKELEAARKKATDAVAARARMEAAAEARDQSASMDAAWDAKARRYVRERRQAEEACAASAAAGKRMRERWHSEWKPPPPPPPPRNWSRARRPNDPFASWRGTTDNANGHGGWEDEDEDEDAVDVSEPTEVTDEERQQARAREAAIERMILYRCLCLQCLCCHSTLPLALASCCRLASALLLQIIARKLKAKERDEAAKRILAIRSKTLLDALGLGADASDSEVDKCVRHMLRLLHPDYAINRCLGDGTRRKLRIEAAFKRLNGLRDE